MPEERKSLHPRTKGRQGFRRPRRFGYLIIRYIIKHDGCLQGDPGISGPKGSQGLRGNKGEKGEPGNWTSSLVAPEFIVTPSKTFEALVGETAVLKCYANGYPWPKITWSRAGSSKGNIITSNGTWVIATISRHGVSCCMSVLSLHFACHIITTLRRVAKGVREVRSNPPFSPPSS
jgi:hypothetical protein